MSKPKEYFESPVGLGNIDLSHAKKCIPYMEKSVNMEDWKRREDLLKESNGGIFPEGWKLEMYPKGVYGLKRAGWEKRIREREVFIFNAAESGVKFDDKDINMNDLLSYESTEEFLSAIMQICTDQGITLPEELFCSLSGD